MEHVKFSEAGKWSDRPCDPVLEVEADETVLVSDSLAKIVVDAGKGERVADPDADNTENKENAESNEDGKAETKDEKKKPGRPKKEKPAVTDKGNAESA